MRQSHTHTQIWQCILPHTPQHTHTHSSCARASAKFIYHAGARQKAAAKGCLPVLLMSSAIYGHTCASHVCMYACVHACVCVCLCAYVFHYTLISAHLSSSDANRHFIIILTTFLRKHESLARWPNLMLILNAPAQDLDHALSRFRSFSNPIQMFLPSASFYLVFRNFTLC